MASGPLNPKTHFYRRPLPMECISFCSPEGKAIFKEALDAGFMENYFALAAQFRTQDEPAFCALSTLVMVLNALEVDPGKVWKGPWRWYHENMLDCCVPIDIIAKSGLTFDQFSCLAICNTLAVNAVRVNDEASEEQFRKEVKRVSLIADEVIVASYSRQALGQTGSGHFSPIGGYHPGRDLVLIMDVARFKYPPHWVSLSLLFEAMKLIDQDTGKPRGYMSLLKSRTLPTILFRLNSFLCVTGFPSTRFIKFANDWNSVLSTSVDSRVSSKVLEICINQLLKLLNTEKMKMIITLIDVIKMSSISDEHREAIQQTVVALEELPIFQTVKRCVPDKVTNDGESIEETEPAIRLQDWHYISMLLLIWPYNKDKDKYGRTLEEMVKDQLEKSKSELLQNEVRLIRQQMISVLDYAVIYSHCPCQEKVNGLASQESLPQIAT